MKIRMSFDVAKIVIICAVLAGVCAIIGLDIALLAGATGSGTSPAIPAVSMAAGIVVGVIALLLLVNSYYKFKNDGLLILIGLFADKVAYDDILFVRQCIDTDELFLIVKDKEHSDKEMGLKVSIAEKFSDDFIKGLREYIPNITVDIFSQPKKKDKEN